MRNVILCAAAAMALGMNACSSSDDRVANGDGGPPGETVAQAAAAPAGEIDGSTSILYAVRGEADLVDDTINVVPDGGVTWIADRPARRAGGISPTLLVRSWPAAGFDSDPPNAVLMTADGSIPIELEDPHRDDAAGAIQMKVTPLTDAKLPSGPFGEVELFIDDAFACSSDQKSYQLQVSTWPEGATPPDSCFDALEQFLSEWDATVRPVAGAVPTSTSVTDSVTIFGVEWVCQITEPTLLSRERVCTSGSSVMTMWMGP